MSTDMLSVDRIKIEAKIPPNVRIESKDAKISIADKDGYRRVTDLPVNRSPAKRCWRLIHDGIGVIGLFESDGITMTIHEMFVSATREECEAEIDRLRLIRPRDPEAIAEEEVEREVSR